MSRPHSLPQPTPPAAGADPWEDWGAESPEFDQAELYDELARPRAAVAAAEPPARAAHRAEPQPAPTLAERLAATPAPAVGVLSADPAELSAALQTYTAATRTPRLVIAVDREPGGRYVASIGSSGHVDAYTAPRGGDALRWLRDVVTGTAPALVVVAEAAGLALADVEPIAREAGCVVAALDSRPGVQAAWEPRELEPLPEPMPEPPKPAPRPRTALKRPTVSSTVAWLAGVADAVRDCPEVIPGPNGERVSVAYGQRDTRGDYVELRGHAERNGHMLPLTVELADGVEVDLADVRVHV